MPRFAGWLLGREQLREPTLHSVQFRNNEVAKAEEPTGIRADDRQDSLPLLARNLSHQRDDLLPVQGLRR